MLDACTGFVCTESNTDLEEVYPDEDHQYDLVCFATNDFVLVVSITC